MLIEEGGKGQRRGLKGAELELGNKEGINMESTP